MREQIFQSGVPIVIGVISFLALAYLARDRRDRFVGFWLTAWGFVVARQVWTLAVSAMEPPRPAGWLGAVLRLATAGALVAGALELRGRRVAWWWLLAAAPGTPLLVWLAEQAAVPSGSARVVPAAATLGTLVAAGLVGVHGTLPAFERRLVAGALAAMAVTSWAATLQPRGAVEALQWWALGAWTSQLLVGLGMMAVYYRMAVDAELAAQRRLGASLAEALSEFVVLCMHCKSVRDEGAGWQRLEAYVAQRSPAQISHGLCPDCAQQHYGVPGPPAPGTGGPGASGPA